MLLLAAPTVTPRQWRLSIDVLADATLVASVTADDQLLMPLARFATPSEALAYLDGALVDFRRGDALSTILTTRGHEPQICLLSNRDGVLSWLGPVLVDVWSRARQALSPGERAAEPFGTSTVTRTRRRPSNVSSAGELLGERHEREADDQAE